MLQQRKCPCPLPAKSTGSQFRPRILYNIYKADREQQVTGRLWSVGQRFPTFQHPAQDQLDAGTGADAPLPAVCPQSLDELRLVLGAPLLRADLLPAPGEAPGGKATSRVRSLPCGRVQEARWLAQSGATHCPVAGVR